MWDSVNRDLKGGNMVNDTQGHFIENTSCSKNQILLIKLPLVRELLRRNMLRPL